MIFIVINNRMILIYKSHDIDSFLFKLYFCYSYHYLFFYSYHYYSCFIFFHSERENKFKHNSSFMSRLSTRRRDRSGMTSPMIPRHSMARRTNSNTADDRDSESADTINR